MDGFYSSILSVYEVPIFESDNAYSGYGDNPNDLNVEKTFTTVGSDDNYSPEETTTTVSGLLPSDYLRLKKAAKRIGLDIYVVGSRAKGTATLTSDWDYVIPGLNSKKWDKIKNSIPGAKTVDKSRNYDLIRSPLIEGLPYIRISHIDEQNSTDL